MNRWTKQLRTQEGFTLIEIILVVVILAISALVAIPVFSSGADMQVRSAANKIAADLDYAKGLAVTHQKYITVVFDPSSESYQIEDAGGVIAHPIRSGELFIEGLAADRRLSKVDINNTTLSGNAVTFDYLGSPLSGGNPLDSGQIELRADSFTLYVKIEPVTGYVTITD